MATKKSSKKAAAKKAGARKAGAKRAGAKRAGAKKAGAKKAGAKKAGAAAPLVFTSFSSGSFSALRAAKQNIAQRLMQSTRPRSSAAFSSFAASTSPSPESNLVGVGIGEKLSGGKHTGVMAVKFLVRIKYPDNQVPPEERLPTQVNGQPVDVEQVGTFRRFQPGAMPNPRRRMRPARPGCSIGFRFPGDQFIMAGTFGALVSKGSRRFILSNNHVIADENRLALGSRIFQPGFLDAGSPPNTSAIARLTRFVPLVGGAPNKVDCAIAELNSLGIANNQTLFIGPPRGKSRAIIDMVVHKFGRTTGFTVGRVTSVETDVNVEYDMGVINFSDQIIIRGLDANPFSASGDSGSLILERSTNKAVGLLFAGSASHTIANHIDDVLRELGGVRLVI
jgi:hypothetical protein